MISNRTLKHPLVRRTYIFICAILAAMFVVSKVRSQQGAGDVIYEPTPQVAVEEMLRMAKVGKDDFVIDLGSGDGRIVITAAKKFGARGLGVDLDPVLIKQSNENARREGVSDRVKFVEQNLFETDLSQATVIALYLLPGMNEKLRPKILKLQPGTRVVAHDYDLVEWRPDEKLKISVPGKTNGYQGLSRLCLWTVPAQIDGEWIEKDAEQGKQPWHFEFRQAFQEFAGWAKTGEHSFRLVDTKLHAGAIHFSFGTDGSYHFEGTAERERITGTLTGGGSKEKKLHLTLVPYKP